MKKLFMMAVTATVLTTSAVAADKEIHSLAEYEALTKQGNVIVDFYAPWCLPCGELSLNLEKLELHKRNVKVYKINVDENPDLQALYGQPQIPTILYMKNGEVLDGHIGSLTTVQLEDTISNYFY